VLTVDRFLNGESKSMATMPMLKICTPPPDMYSMNACIGNDLTGEMANSHAFFFFSASCELSASADKDADAGADDVVVVVEEEDLPCPLPCIEMRERMRVLDQLSLFRLFSSPSHL